MLKRKKGGQPSNAPVNSAAGVSEEHKLSPLGVAAAQEIVETQDVEMASEGEGSYSLRHSSKRGTPTDKKRSYDPQGATLSYDELRKKRTQSSPEERYQTTWEDLPPEIVSHLGGFLPGSSLLSLSSTNWRNRLLFSENALKKRVFFRIDSQRMVESNEKHLTVPAPIELILTTDMLKNSKKPEKTELALFLERNLDNILSLRFDYSCEWRDEQLNKTIEEIMREVTPSRRRKMTIQFASDGEITYSKIDTSHLWGVNTLTLNYCRGVTDVSALGGVTNLNLHGCRGITDVSGLGGVTDLDLSYCDGVIDVSALGGVTDLNLSECEGVIDVSGLGGVTDLNLSECEGVIDVSALGSVTNLHLHGCRGITDVSALGGVANINLSWCSRVTDVSALGGVTNLHLSCCAGVIDVSALGGVEKLNLSYCGVTDVSALGGVTNLNLEGCSGVTDVSALGGVTNLGIRRCYGIKITVNSENDTVAKNNLEALSQVTNLEADPKILEALRAYKEKQSLVEKSQQDGKPAFPSPRR